MKLNDAIEDRLDESIGSIILVTAAVFLAGYLAPKAVDAIEKWKNRKLIAEKARLETALARKKQKTKALELAKKIMSQNRDPELDKIGEKIAFAKDAKAFDAAFDELLNYIKNYNN
jgi:hypothetical protein